MGGALVFAAGVGLGENPGEPRDGRRERRGVIGPDHAAARRKPQRFDDARVVNARGERAAVVTQVMQGEARHRHPGCREGHPLAMLVTRRERRVDRVPLHPERCGDPRREHRRVVVHAHDSGHRVSRREARRLLHGPLGTREIQSEEAGGHGALEGAGLLRGDGQVDAEAAGGLDESGGTIRRGGEKKENAGQVTSSRRRSTGWRRRRDR